MAKARRKLRALRELPPPERADGDEAAWAKSVYLPWIKSKQKLLGETIVAYQAAFRTATPEQKLAVQFALGEVNRAVYDEFIEVGMTSLEDVIFGDEEARKALRDALAERFTNMLARAGEHYEECNESAVGQLQAHPTAVACRAGLRDVTARLAPAQASRKQERLWSRWRVGGQPEVGKRRFIKTAQAVPCQFRGTATLGIRTASLSYLAAAFATRAGNEHPLTLGSVEVSRLVLPSARGERARVDIEWPIRATIWLAPDLLPLELRCRVDVVRKRTWLGRGARVGAIAGRKSGRAIIRRPGALVRQGAAADFETDVPCANLALAGSFPRKPKRAKRTMTVDDATLLYDKPKGNVIGRTASLTAEIVQQREGWMRIAGARAHTTPNEYDYSAVDFDAWVKAEAQRSGIFGGLLGDLSLDDPFSPAKTFAKPLEVRLGADDNASVLGTIEPGVPIVIGPERDGFVAVKIPHIDLASEKADLWVKKTDLDETP